MWPFRKNRVRRSIDSKIILETGQSFVDTGYKWFPIVFGIKVISKSPARLKIIGFSYIVFQGILPIQSGKWVTGLTFSSVGYKTPLTVIEGKHDSEIFMAVNPFMLGKWPPSNKDWHIYCDINIDCGYGIISRPFETEKVSVGTQDTWTKYKSEFDKVNV